MVNVNPEMRWDAMGSIETYWDAFGSGGKWDAFGRVGTYGHTSYQGENSGANNGVYAVGWVC